jgi:hypothetical protein
MIFKRFLTTLAAAPLLFAAPAHAQPRNSAETAWKPFITGNNELLWMLRSVFTGSREYDTNVYALNRPTLRRSAWSAQPGAFGNRRVQQGPYQTIDVRDATFISPIQWHSASSEAFPSHLQGRLQFNALEITREWIGEPASLPDVINVEWYVRVADDSGNSLVPIIDQPEQVNIDFRLPVRTFETVFEEKRAMDIEWQTALPAWTQPFLDPQPFIASDDPFVAGLVNEWTKNDPRAMTPARLAKFLAAQVIDAAQPGVDPRAFWPEPSQNLTFPDTGGGYPYSVQGLETGPFLRGFDVQNERVFVGQTEYLPRIREPIEAGRANAAVITNLYVALLRSAGIPARVMIGIVPPQSELATIGKRASVPATDDGRTPIYRFWAEFYLWDEHAQRGQWIPVDIVRQREESSRSRPLDQSWRYFGNHDELDQIVPISSIYAVESSARMNAVPALWGWRPLPVPAFGLDAVIRYEVMGATRRPGDGLGEIGVKRAR